MNAINIGVIGSNLTAYVHLESLETIIKSRVLSGKVKISIDGICPINEDQLQEIKNDFNIPKIYNDYHTLIDDPSINTIFITSSPKLHKEIFLYAAKAHKNIFCEKQVALSLSDIEEMIQIRNDNSVVSQIGFVLRDYPIFWFTKNMIENPKNQQIFGKLQNIIIRDDLQRPLIEVSQKSNDEEKFVTGILFEHSINDIDLLRYFFGEINDVYAKIKYFNDVTQSEDSVAVTFDLENGSTAQLTSIWHNMARDERTIEIFFENTLIKLTFTWREGKLVVIEKDGLTNTYTDSEIDESFREEIGFPDLYPFTSGGYGYEILLFLKRITLNDTKNESFLTASLEDGLIANKIINTCYESSKENKRIELY